jgi:hypothetical protein
MVKREVRVLNPASRTQQGITHTHTHTHTQQENTMRIYRVHYFINAENKYDSHIIVADNPQEATKRLKEFKGTTTVIVTEVEYIR